MANCLGWRQIQKTLRLLEDNDVFIQYCKDFADKVSETIDAGYKSGKTEPDIVEDVSDTINRVSKIPGTYGKGKKFSLETKASFIHGYRSQVKFNVSGCEKWRELGDIVFISTLAWKRKIAMQRITFNQVKKDRESRKAYWEIPSDQLYLLTKFPSFTGIKGSIYSGKTFNLISKTGCLGSYGFLTYPNDFGFLSSSILDLILSGKASVRKRDLVALYPLIPGQNCFSNSVYPHRSIHYAQNLFDFIRYFCNIMIGEYVCCCNYINDPIKRILDVIINYLDVLSSSASEDQSLKAVVASLKHFDNMYSDVFSTGDSFDGSGTDRGLPGDNPENGGFAVIHHITTIEEDL